ncbi:MAG: hypothetical protein N2327_08200 [Caldimicrobium sp.]|nr:hypothetical protein [Caldimicrobium sp.]MCX7874389.1 hypothetical protein [Caldimicrobium sp.]MDW8094025.1 hypothetical protein [Caldimicrobium sp.]
MGYSFDVPICDWKNHKILERESLRRDGREALAIMENWEVYR